MVCHHLTIVFQVLVGTGIGQAHDAAHACIGGRNDVAIVLAGGHVGTVDEADDTAQAAGAGGGHGIDLVAVVFTVIDFRTAVGGGDDAGGTSGLRVHIRVIVAG